MASEADTRANYIDPALRANGAKCRRRRTDAERDVGAARS
jgi:hypothetical protein